MDNLKQGEKQTIRQFICEIEENFVDKYGHGDKDDFSFTEMRRRVMGKCLIEGMREEIFKRMSDEIKDQKEDLLWSTLTEAAQDAEWLWSLHHRKIHRGGMALSRSYNFQDFSLDDDGYVIVYTDGACLRNGQPDAVAGLGVWFGEDHFLNVSEPVCGAYPATNNVAEIRAVVRAIEIVKEHGIEQLAVYTDSMYLMDSITKWMFKWLTNGWKTFDGQPLKNKQQYQELLMAMEHMDMKWIHVRGHSHHKGNVMADQLAGEGAMPSGGNCQSKRIIDALPLCSEEQAIDLKQGAQSIREFIRKIDEAFVQKYGNGSRSADPGFAAMCRRIKKNCLFKGMDPCMFNMGMRIDVRDPKIDFSWRTLAEAAQDAEWQWSLYAEAISCRNGTPYNNPQGFDVDNQGHVIVYIDANCLREGQPDAVAGIGVWFDDGHHLNVSEPMYGVQPPTKHMAEIKAVLKVLEIVKKHGVERLKICTESYSLTKLINVRLYYYLRNGWKMYSDDRWWKTNDEPLLYREEYRGLLMCMEGLDVKWGFDMRKRWKQIKKVQKLAADGALLWQKQSV